MSRALIQYRWIRSNRMKFVIVIMNVESFDPVSLDSNVEENGIREFVIFVYLFYRISKASIQ